MAMLTGIEFRRCSMRTRNIFFSQAPYRLVWLLIILRFRVPEILYYAFAFSQVNTVHFCLCLGGEARFLVGWPWITPAKRGGSDEQQAMFRFFTSL